MTSLVPGAFLGALIFAVTNWLKFVRARDWNAVLTQLCVWAGGFVVVWLAAQTITFGEWAPLGHAIKALGLADLLFVGVALGSSGTAGNELLKAVDRSNTQVTPPLFPKLVPLSRRRAERPLHKKAA